MDKLSGITNWGGIYFLLSSFFNIHNIVVTGNEKITPEMIISLSGNRIRKNTFKVSKSEVEQAIKTNAYIDSVKIKEKITRNNRNSNNREKTSIYVDIRKCLCLHEHTRLLC